MRIAHQTTFPIYLVEYKTYQTYKKTIPRILDLRFVGTVDVGGNHTGNESGLGRNGTDIKLIIEQAKQSRLKSGNC